MCTTAAVAVAFNLVFQGFLCFLLVRASRGPSVVRIIDGTAILAVIRLRVQCQVLCAEILHGLKDIALPVFSGLLTSIELPSVGRSRRREQFVEIRVSFRGLSSQLAPTVCMYRAVKLLLVLQ